MIPRGDVEHAAAALACGALGQTIEPGVVFAEARRRLWYLLNDALLDGKGRGVRQRLQEVAGGLRQFDRQRVGAVIRDDRVAHQRGDRADRLVIGAGLATERAGVLDGAPGSSSAASRGTGSRERSIDQA